MMSALPPKADISCVLSYVRFVPKADIRPEFPRRCGEVSRAMTASMSTPLIAADTVRRS
jgi:hypothetical protein